MFAHPSSAAAVEFQLDERSPAANERLAVLEGFARDEVAQLQIPWAGQEEEGGPGGLRAGR